MKHLISFIVILGLVQVAKAQSFEIKVVQEENRQIMYYTGEIFNPKFSQDLLQIYVQSLRQLRKNKPLFLVLNSPGGDVGMANRISLDMQRICNGNCLYTTVVESKVSCSSACVNVFLSGVERLANDDSKFLVHSGYSAETGFSTALEMAAGQYWGGMDVDWLASFIDKTGAYTDGRDITITGRKDLLESGLVTHVHSELALVK